MQPYSTEIETQLVHLYQSLSEKERRRYAAVEAAKLDHGGIAYLAGLFHCDPDTIRKGAEDVQSLPQDDAEHRVRKKGRTKES